MGKKHGRFERRSIVTTTALNSWLAQWGWPGVRQVFRVTRQVTCPGVTRTEVACGITSLPREQANAPQLLSLNRGHWGIENRLFYVLDKTLDEDHCRLNHTPRATQPVNPSVNSVAVRFSTSNCR